MEINPNRFKSMYGHESVFAALYIQSHKDEVQNSRNIIFLKKSTRQGCTTQNPRLRMQPHCQIVLPEYTYPSISRISTGLHGSIFQKSYVAWGVTAAQPWRSSENHTYAGRCGSKGASWTRFTVRSDIGRRTKLQPCSGQHCRLRNSDGWRDFFWRLFRTRLAMGRLWDDHFRDLGYPPKFYEGQNELWSSTWWRNNYACSDLWFVSDMTWLESMPSWCRRH